MLRNHFKKWTAFTLSLLMALLMVGNIGSTAFASETDDMSVTINAAQIIAENHVASALSLSDEGIVDDWHWGMLIDGGTPLYDINDEVTAYHFKLTDENNNNDAGYVVVGASENVAPIIEYGTKGSFFPVDISNEMYTDSNLSINEEDIKVYYAGGIDYLVGIENENDEMQYFDVSSDEEIIDITDQIDIASSRIMIDNNDYSSEWEMWKPLTTPTMGTRSNPPTSGGAITNPDSYETGYASKTAKNVTGYNLIYIIMTNFSGYSSHCAPTAATNLMYYWYNRSNSTYSALRKDGDSTWKKTFESFHSLMGTTSSNGTYNVNLQSAYSTYLNNAGFNSSTVTYSSSASWSTMQTEIDNNYPFHLVVQSHYYYGNHSILGIGYQEFIHGTLSYSRYIRVADGWSSSSGRYVHTSVGSSTLRMVKVRPA